MAIATTATAQTFHVSTSAAPGGDGSAQRPFAQIQQAIDAAEGRRGVKIVLAAGTYRLGAPLRLGAGHRDLTIQSAPRAKVILSGGTELQMKLDGLRRRAMLPEGRRFTSLYVNGVRRFRPRLPKQGYYTIKALLDPEPDVKQTWGRFRFRPGEITDEMVGSEAELSSLVWWTMARLRIKSVNQDLVHFVEPDKNATNWVAFAVNGRYFIDNAPGAIGPGEWRIDGRELTYVPLPQERLDSTSVVAPLIDRLVILQGSENVTLTGLTFSHTNWVLPPQGRSFPQAEADLPAAIEATDCSGVKIVKCELNRLDSYAVELGKGSRNCVVENCRMTDLGAGGVKIGTQVYEKDESKVAGHNVVRNNLFAHGGRVHPAGEGVWIGHSPYNKIEHNEIVDFYYTGISVGWSWGYGESNSHHNLIARNLIHQIGQNVLSDMGGIYLLGVAPGTVVKENLIYDVNSFGYGGWAIYPDQGSSHLLIEGNVCYDTKSPGYHQHFGKANLLRDNVFAFGREGQVRLTRADEGLSFTFERNIVLWKDAPFADPDAAKTGFAFDRNLYWRTDGKALEFGGLTFEDWQKSGQDLNSRIADPLFVDPLNGDFHLKPGSPARKMGMGGFEKALDAWPVAKRYKGTMAPAFPLK